MDREFQKLMQKRHWERKEADRLAGEAWIREHGSEAEKAALSGLSNDN